MPRDLTKPCLDAVGLGRCAGDSGCSFRGSNIFRIAAYFMTPQAQSHSRWMHVALNSFTSIQKIGEVTSKTIGLDKS